MERKVAVIFRTVKHTNLVEGLFSCWTSGVVSSREGVLDEAEEVMVDEEPSAEGVQMVEEGPGHVYVSLEVGMAP
jgi:hypothetical protein